MIKIRRVVPFVVALLVLTFSPGIWAHHGYAAYDMTKTVAVKGSVTDLMLANPHSSLSFDVKDDKGNLEHWAVEFGTLRGLIADGWTRSTLKPGDQINISLHPSKNGAKVGVLSG